MISGNYVHFEETPSPDSETADDHVQFTTTGRKKQFIKNSNGLRRTFSLTRLDDETDYKKYNNKMKEQRLFRNLQSITADEIHFRTKHFEKSPSDDSGRSPVKRPRRVLYNPRKTVLAKKKSSSRLNNSLSSTLEYITTHGKKYTTYEDQTITRPKNISDVEAYMPNLEKTYFKPHEERILDDQNSQPDSLCQESSASASGTDKLVKVLLVLRWPLVLVTICTTIALLLFVFLPDSVFTDSNTVNGTYWEPTVAKAQTHHKIKNHALYKKYRSHLRKSQIDKALSEQCHPTRLSVCRKVLPYNLVGAPATVSGQSVTSLLPQIKYLASTNCSRRLRLFTCALLEPECNPRSHTTKLPCYNLCKAIVDSCDSKIPTKLTSVFNCNQYFHEDCVAAKAPCLDGESSCFDGTCIPKNWVCDGPKDCPNGEDESACSHCNNNEYNCKSGSCIARQLLCDGNSDCPEGEDEEKCGKSTEPNNSENILDQMEAWYTQTPLVRQLKEALNGQISTTDMSTLKKQKSKDPVIPLRSLTPGLSSGPLIQLPSSAELRSIKIEQKKQEKDNLNFMESMEEGNIEDIGFSDENAAALVKRVQDAEEVRYARDSEDEEVIKRNSDLPLEDPMNILNRPVRVTTASPCPSGELRCVDGNCITLIQLCDGNIDCSDHADEDNCFA